MNVMKITQEQAEAVLQLRHQNPVFAKNWLVMCKGYEEDWDNYTEVVFDELDNVAEGCYDDFQLWLEG